MARDPVTSSDDIVRFEAAPRNAGEPGCGSSSQHLGVTFKFAGKGKPAPGASPRPSVRHPDARRNRNITESASCARAREAASSSPVLAGEILSQEIWRLRDQQIDVFVRPERTRNKTRSLSGDGPCRRKVKSAVDAIVNGMYILATKPADPFRHVPAITSIRRRIPEWRATAVDAASLRFVSPPRQYTQPAHIAIELRAQCHEGCIERPFPGKK